MKLFTSASRVVFILMASATVVLTFIGTVEAKDFIALTGMAFVHFFNKSKSENTQESTNQG